MKVIFLDFDGVITSYNSRWTLMPVKMNYVARICAETGAKIVISSSWRQSSLESTLKDITNPEAPYVEDKPDTLSNFTIDVTPRLDCNKYGRGDEIQWWLDRHPEVTNYVIIDDDTFDMLPNQMPHVVESSWEDGISKEMVDHAIEILNAH